MSDIAIKVDHLSKEYRLGAIGGGTLRGDLQTLWARICKKEDPNAKIGTRTDIKIGERFLALDDVSFEVKKGEALGIIGHNGAGKSTLLKILSRVTGPSKGSIQFNGRIASMLEVGTGFHPELTGRENVYMNGAILGMSKTEIDKKFDEIMEFAEIAKFIDTPVKRYSSGMYVKLAFSVAAHLDSEIMIMDEVLAVGDVNFQDKCLSKMGFEAAKGKTVLYVSHNMNTIKRLCQRCLVLKKGQVEYIGEPGEAIRLYRGGDAEYVERDLIHFERSKNFANHPVTLEYIALTNTVSGKIMYGTALEGFVDFSSETDFSKLSINLLFHTSDGLPVTKSETPNVLQIVSGQKARVHFKLDISCLVPGKYILTVFICQRNQTGTWNPLDLVRSAVSFTVTRENNFNENVPWDIACWGNVINKPISIEDIMIEDKSNSCQM